MLLRGCCCRAELWTSERTRAKGGLSDRQRGGLTAPPWGILHVCLNPPELVSCVPVDTRADVESLYNRRYKGSGSCNMPGTAVPSMDYGSRFVQYMQELCKALACVVGFVAGSS